MSIVVCYLADTFSIIGTDTRVVYKLDGEVIKYDDEAEKLYQTNIGWVSAAGLGCFINKFKESINQAQIKTASELKDIFDKAYNDTFQEWPGDKSDIDSTAIALSFGVKENNKATLYIGQLSKNFNSGDLSILNKYSFYIIWPFDISDTIKLYIYEKYSAIIDGLDDKDKVTYYIAKLIQEITQNQLSETVSSVCQIGYLDVTDGRFEIFQIKLPSDMIINAYESAQIK